MCDDDVLHNEVARNTTKEKKITVMEGLSIELPAYTGQYGHW